MKKYIFLIDTDLYAGNFEREITAHLTGIVGDCNGGAEYAELYRQETGDTASEKFEELLEFRFDDSPTRRPCSIWESNSRKKPYNSVAIFFYKKPSKKIIEFLKGRVELFAEAKRNMNGDWNREFRLKILGFRLLQEETIYTELPI